MRNKVFLTFLLFVTGCSSTGFLGLPGPQDGTWLATPTAVGTISSLLLGISHDQLIRINLNGAEWTINQSFAASRTATDVTWKSVATPPAGAANPLFPNVNTEFDVMVTLQADGTLSGTIAQGISTIPGIASIPTSTTPIVMRKI